MTTRRSVRTALLALLAAVAGGAALAVSATSTWETKASIPVPKGVRFLYQSPVEIGGRIYVVYGRVYEFDPAMDGWRTFPAPLPTPRNHHGTAAVGGRIYTLGGGLPGDVRLDTVEEFDPATGEWRARAPMPGPRRNMGAAVVAGSLYVLGGEGALPGAMPIVRYDPRSNAWTPMKAVTRIRHCWGAQVVGGKIYIVGNVGREEAPDGAVDEYDPAADTIVARRPMPRARNAFATAVADGRMFVLGGEAADNLPLDHVDVYDVAAGAWSPRSALPQARRWFGAIALHDKLYVLGGLTTRDWDRPDAGTLAIDVKALSPAASAPVSGDPPRLFLAGDSTMADKPLDLPERGWGMILPEFLTDARMVHNAAVNGRSTKSFIDEGRWQALIDQVRAGDFVIVQFGHNDEKVEDRTRGTDPKTTFPENLRRFVREVRDRQATAILATPVCRRKFDAAGKLVMTHGEYPDAVRAVAAEDGVPLLDLERATAKWLEEAGDEPSKAFFMWIEPGKYPKLPEGRQDDTHFVDAGARRVAEMAVAQIRALKLPLAAWLK